MRSAKPYTNATFTRRVDHDGGRHRPPRKPSEPALCPGCGAVYAKRRWSHSANARLFASATGRPLEIRICGACRRRDVGTPHGYLHIDGEFFPAHRAEMEQLLHNEVARAQVDNPLHQVLGWEDLGSGSLLITTSTEHLVQRLGHTLEKAYGGQVQFGFSHENKLARIWWHR